MRVKMRQLGKLGALVAGGVSLMFSAGCAVEIPRATGPLTVSPTVEQNLHDWAAKGPASTFAVSLDGRTSVEKICAQAPCSVMDESSAVTSCSMKSQGSKCVLYASGGKYVWNNEPVRPPATQPASTVRRGDTLVGVRQLAFTWEGYASSMNATLRFEENGRNGTIEMALPDKAKCTGNYGFYDKGAGNWFLRCENGLTASGTFQKPANTAGTVAVGKDSRDRRITSLIFE
jgi:hypothetical protein